MRYRGKETQVDETAAIMEETALRDDQNIEQYRVQRWLTITETP